MSCATHPKMEAPATVDATVSVSSATEPVAGEVVLATTGVSFIFSKLNYVFLRFRSQVRDD